MHLSNYHSHCSFCDGRSMPEEFVKFALAKSFRAYGISSHGPLPFETFWNMSAFDMPEYLVEISRLKDKYQGHLEIYTGMEIDYLDTTYNPSIPYFQNLPLDYRIGSVHFLPIATELCEANMVCIDGPFSEFKKAVDTYFEGDIRKMVKRYYESSIRMVELGGIDIVGHLDKIYMNGQRCKDFSFTAPWYRNMVNEYLEVIAGKGLIVEINTKNLLKKQQTFPRQEYLSRMRELQIPVMVNSDCHTPDLVNDGRQEAFDMLKQAGYKSTCELIAGSWQSIPF